MIPKVRNAESCHCNRRQFIKGAAAMGLSAMAGAWPVSKARAKEKIVLRYLVSGVHEFSQIADRALADLNIQLEYHPSKNFQETFLKLMTRPQSYDLIDIDYGILKHFVQADMLKNLDARRLQYLDKYVSIFTRGKLAGKDLSPQGGAPFLYTFVQGAESNMFSREPTDWMCAMPISFNADTLGIRPDLIERPIRHWSELLNPEFTGAASIINVPGIGILDAALAVESIGGFSYRDKGNMTRKEIDYTIEVLIDAKHRGQFFDVWSDFNKSVAMMASSDVVIQSMWSPAVTRVRQLGKPCIYQPLEEGYRGWCYGLAMPKTVSGRKLDAVYDFLNWYHSGWVGGFMNRQGYYSVVPETAQKFMEPYEWDYWMRGKPAAQNILSPDNIVVEPKGSVRDGGAFEQRMSHIACWNFQMDEARYLQKRWQDFINA